MTFSVTSWPEGLKVSRGPLRKFGRRFKSQGLRQETHGWWVFDAQFSDRDCLDELRGLGYEPNGFWQPVVSAFGGTQNVSPATLVRKGSRVLVKQSGYTQYT